jgi:hypothetical protein
LVLLQVRPFFRSGLPSPISSSQDFPVRLAHLHEDGLAILGAKWCSLVPSDLFCLLVSLIHLAPYAAGLHDRCAICRLSALPKSVYRGRFAHELASSVFLSTGFSRAACCCSEMRRTILSTSPSFGASGSSDLTCFTRASVRTKSCLP